MSWIRMAIGGAAFLGVATVASAQAPQAPPQGGAANEQGEGRGKGNEKAGDRDARLTKRMLTGIELTAEQLAQVEKIREKSAAEIKAVMPTNGDLRKGDEAMRAKMLEITTRAQGEYRAILTPEQQVIFDKNVAFIKERRDRRAKQEKIK